MDWKVLGLHTEGIVDTATSIAWNADGMSNWLLSVRKVDEEVDSGMLMETTMNYVTVGGLDTAQWYVAQVRTVCDTEYSGPWSDTIMFYVPTPSEVGNGCKKPKWLQVIGIYAESATLLWNAGSGTQWELEYGTAATPLGSGTLKTAPTYYASCNNLEGAAWYWARVRTVCDTDWKSDWTDTVMFYIDGPEVKACEKPTGLRVENVVYDRVTLRWNAGGADKWHVEIGKQNASVGQLLVASDSVILIGGLDTMQWYWSRVRMECDSDSVSEWTDTVMFYIAEKSNGITEAERYTYLMPNPAREEVTVLSSYQIREVELYGADGKMQRRQEVNAESATLDLKGLPAGIYFVRVATHAGVTTKRLIIE